MATLRSRHRPYRSESMSRAVTRGREHQDRWASPYVTAGAREAPHHAQTVATGGGLALRSGTIGTSWDSNCDRP
jgi:hypothetical protein